MNYAPFILRCPECTAPSEEFATHCQYCKIALTWRPVISLGALEAYEAPIQYVEPPSEPGSIPLGFGPAMCAPHASLVLTSIPQLSLRPLRLILPPGIAKDIMVDDIKVGNRSQFVNATSVSGWLFSPESKGVAMAFDALNVGMFMSLHLSNMTPHGITMSAVVQCEKLDFQIEHDRLIENNLRKKFFTRDPMTAKVERIGAARTR